MNINTVNPEYSQGMNTMSITKLMSKLVEIELTQDVVSKALLIAMQSGKDTPVKLSVSLPNPLEINVKPLSLPRLKPEKTPTQVLTREDVLKILSMRFIDKKSGGEITKVFPKVNRSTVYAILSGRTWKDVYNEFMTKHKIK